MITRKLVLQALMRNSLDAFCQKTFHTVSPSDRYLSNWHLSAIANALEQCYRGNIKRLIITMPPRSLKSIFTSIAFPCWVLGLDPTKRIICASYSADLAQKFQRLLMLARPDPEEELAGLIGDAAAHQVGTVLRQAADWGRRSGGIVAANLREYLQEEQRDIPSSYEMGRFSRDVQTLRDDVERAEARLDRLERRRT